MTKISITMDGLKPMQRVMLKGVSQQKITDVVRLNLMELTQAAKAKAPVSTEKTNPGGDHGHLKRSILPEMVDANTGKVTATAHYSEYVELGTRYMRAQPYMRPAAEAQEKQFISDLEKLIKKELR